MRGHSWISKRAMQTGTSLNTNKGKTYKDKPLVKIKRVLMWSTDMFSAHVLLLECGHIVRGWGEYKARCRKCRDKKPPDTKELKEWERILL